MSLTTELFELQQIDTGLDKRLARLRQIDDAMLDNPVLVEARTAHEAGRLVVADRQAALKQLSHEAEEISTRSKSQEKRLYDGSVKNPKDLGQIQEEVAHLKARYRTLEDSMLDAMMLSEEAEEGLQTLSTQLDNTTKEWEQYKAGLLEEKDKLTDQARVLQVKRQRMITEIPWADLQAYERLRRSKGGIAVAAVQEGGMCEGCRVSVPVHVLRAARTGGDLTTCPSCQRILNPLSDVKFKEFNHDLDNINR